MGSTSSRSMISCRTLFMSPFDCVSRLAQSINHPLGRWGALPDFCRFFCRGMNGSEILHCQPVKKRWEYELLIDFLSYQGKELFTRSRLWQFLSTKDGWERTPSNETKVTRFLSRMKTWGFIIEREYNKYELNLDDIKRLEESR